ncbi:MAG: tRNA epoxyqueuosine(34) reductase QueG [Fibrobacterota bacterium]
MKSEIKAFASQAGIPAIGFCRPELTEEERARFRAWLDAGGAAGMASLSRNIGQRLMETPLLDGQRSVVMCGFPYPTDGERAFVSDYALLDDYHVRVNGKLGALGALIKKRWPDAVCRAFVDTSPVPEKLLAARAGLGFIGKNSLLIHPQHGTRLFLGGLLTTLDIMPDAPVTGGCGTCDVCVYACPTAALSEQGLDARLCLSYHTIENKGEIPEPARSQIRNKVFGCSACEQVCPKNSAAGRGEYPEWNRSHALAEADLQTLARMCGESFRKHFGHTPVYRTGRKALLRNITIAVGNTGKKEYISNDRKVAR